MQDSIYFNRIGINVTLRCTLKCRLCCAHVPYYRLVPHYSLETLIDYVHRLFALVDTVSIFCVTGGEPLLNTCLSEFIAFLKTYRERILKRLEVITNGTILPNDELLNAMRENDVFVLLDDYGPDCSRNVQVVEDKLIAYGINYNRRRNNSEKAYYDGWVDLSTFSEIPKKKEDAIWLSKNCIQANELRCHPIVDGKIFVCASYKRCFDLGRITDNPDEYFDLMDDTISLEEKKTRIMKFLRRDVFSACAYCNGWLSDSKRFVPGEQLP